MEKMTSRLLLLLTAIACFPGNAKVLQYHGNDEGKHWALLVAGSKGWYNYRHQADISHAYQIVKRNGIPEENIIVMMYDDIAYNENNPAPGFIFNHPKGKNVYKDINIDYKGKDVNPENFLAILSGRRDMVKGNGTGKVINSGPNDNIFVNYADHGDAGILAFPNHEYLNARDLINTLKQMHEDNKYKQMVLYVEACLSGSMFENLLPDNINIYATTASNSVESSYGCYWDKRVYTYVGDVYSVNWMEDSDRGYLKEETLEEQFQITKKKTTTSHVQEYGDKSVSQESVADFQGGPNKEQATPIILSKVPLDAIPSEDVPLEILKRRLADAKDEELRKRLQNEINNLLELRSKIAKTMKEIVEVASNDFDQCNRILTTQRQLQNFDCYEPTLKLFHERCYNIVKNDAARTQTKFLVNMCEEDISVDRIMEAIAKVCKA